MKAFEISQQKFVHGNSMFPHRYYHPSSSHWLVIPKYPRLQRKTSRKKESSSAPQREKSENNVLGTETAVYQVPPPPLLPSFQINLPTPRELANKKSSHKIYVRASPDEHLTIHLQHIPRARLKMG